MTLRAIEGIPNDKVFVEGYANFLRDMVYGDAPNFNTAIGITEKRWAIISRKYQTIAMSRSPTLYICPDGQIPARFSE